ncbi:YndM family protein [Alkalibacillus aidingensis]|uniref:YndM family protein n=1 Tax=Alkalibacillus aidingensis TaxID=2747607 RepID=UPI0016616719|nr:YndM family protein [Alkalibacillus aidingensis]
MNHFKLIITKCIASLILLYAILGFVYDVTFMNVLLITLVLGAISYIIGDLFILLRTNNTVATISDFILSFVVVYFMLSFMIPGGPLFGASLFAAIGVTVFELFFHMFVKSDHEQEERERPTERDTRKPNNYRLQTEASEELRPDYKRNDKPPQNREVRNEMADELNPDDFDQLNGRPRNQQAHDDITDELNPDDFEDRK